MKKESEMKMGLIVCASCGSLIRTFPNEKVSTIYSFCRGNCEPNKKE